MIVIMQFLWLLNYLYMDNQYNYVMKKILFPTDFSNVAENAFLHALSVAKMLHGEVILLHTYELPIVDNQFVPGNYQEMFDSLELSNFDRFKDEIAKMHSIAEANNFGSIKLSPVLRDGDLLFTMKQLIEEENIDLVVMGTSGAEGWKEVFFGTNTGDAVTSLPVPVLSVPADSKFAPLKTIGFTTRYREKDKEALRQVLKIAKAANAAVKCLYVKTKVSDNTEATFDDWEQIFKNEPVKFFVLPNENVKESILDFITNQEIDVLAMLTYKRNFFQSMFSGSFTEKMVNNATIPVLAFHE